MTVPEAVGYVVLARRLEVGLSQRQLARAMGLSKNQRSWVSKIENAISVPSMGTFGRLAEALGMTGSTLLSAAEEFSKGVNGGTIEAPDEKFIIKVARKPSKLLSPVKNPQSIARRRKIALSLGTLPPRTKA